MPDISMCTQKDCPKAKTCYRFLATPDRWQSYMSPDFTEDGCDAYWKIDVSKSEIKRLDTIHSLADFDVNNFLKDDE